MILSDERSEDGKFVRQEDRFRNWVTRDGASGYLAEPNRYHLYVSLACPWAHRTVIIRKLKKLENVIGMTVVDPIRDGRGWAFRNGPEHSEDPINGFQYLSEAYRATEKDFNDRVTVPVLWDKKTGRIVSNAEDDIMRMFNSEFNAFTDSQADFYPQELRAAIDEVNDFVYPNINDGVYRAGFATSQEAYEGAVRNLFDALDGLEERLNNQRYLVGNQITEADWRLFPTLIRFDAVYHGHFKCNVRRIIDYPNLWGYLRALYQHDGIAETVNFDHIKRHYYVTHTDINPTQIVPIGPNLNFSSPHGRDALKYTSFSVST
ncbi:glutathione S-transferase family protein [Candidatus Poribacteria bacterium]|nr:glutathione S-transferase family protein [Candidatus Poribacteria bacterium]